MEYTKPELIVLGPASALVQGVPDSTGDNTNGDIEQLPLGFVAGLDD